jgi:ATP-dependent RNA helicase RhlB
VLVATDIAARGIDIDEITHVVNFDLPNVPETYVHRIGRTARAGASGDAVSFACERYVFSLPEIEEYIGHKLPVHPVLPEMQPILKPPARREYRPRPGAERGRGGRPDRHGGRARDARPAERGRRPERHHEQEARRPEPPPARTPEPEARPLRPPESRPSPPVSAPAKPAASNKPVVKPLMRRTGGDKPVIG